MSDQPQRKRGIVKKADYSRGYAFIRGEDGIRRYANMRGRPSEDKLQRGQSVEFDDLDARAQGERRIRAVNVRII